MLKMENTKNSSTFTYLYKFVQPIKLNIYIYINNIMYLNAY